MYLYRYIYICIHDTYAYTPFFPNVCTYMGRTSCPHSSVLTLSRCSPPAGNSPGILRSWRLELQTYQARSSFMAREFVRECSESAVVASNPPPEVSPKVQDVYKESASLCHMHETQLLLDHNTAFESYGCIFA